jgi:hypothetical protein
MSVFSTTELLRFGWLSLTGGPTLSVSPGSSSELVHFLYLSVLQNLSDPATSPAGRRAHARPTRPEQPWCICQKAPLLRVCAVRQRRFLNLTSLPCGAHPSVPSISPHRPTPISSPPLVNPRPPESHTQPRHHEPTHFSSPSFNPCFNTRNKSS